MEQMVNVAVQTDVQPGMCDEVVLGQRGALLDKQCETELSSASTKNCPTIHPVADSECNTIKLEPTWSWGYLYGRHVAYPCHKVIISSKRQALLYQFGRMCLRMTTQSRHFGPSGRSWNSEIKYCADDGRREVVPKEYTSKELSRDCTSGSP